MEAGAYCAVNCFAMVTGFLMVKQSFKISRFANLWLQVLFYQLLITVLFQIFSPDSVSKGIWFYAFLPVASNNYWYFTAYAGLFFLIPGINAMMKMLNQKQAAYLIAVIFLLFSCYITVPVVRGGVFGLNAGYSTPWLILTYIAGAYFGLHGENIRLKKRYSLSGYVLAVLLTCLAIPVMNFLTFRLFNRCIGSHILYNYTSPTIVVSAVMLLLFFSKLRVSERFVKIVRLLSVSSFAVYLIHQYPLMVKTFLRNRFIFLLEWNPLFMAGGVILFAVAVYLFCTVIESLRRSLFNALRIEKYTGKLDTLLEKLIPFGK